MTPILSSGWLTASAAVMGLVVLVWFASLWKRDVSIIDWFWAAAFALFAWVALTEQSAWTLRPLLLASLLTLWALRLGLHLVLRSRGKAEDPRYQAMRRKSGRSFWWVSLFKVNLFQGLLVALISAPVWQVVRSHGVASWSALDTVATAMILAGVAVEAIADLQLTRFRNRSESRGRVLDTGLWRYSRHPNYFGNALLWWGIGLLALATPGSAWSLFGPLVMTFLLLRVSGVTLLEESLVETRPRYREYIERTSSFIPWPPRKGKS